MTNRRPLPEPMESAIGRDVRRRADRMRADAEATLVRRARLSTDPDLIERARQIRERQSREAIVEDLTARGFVVFQLDGEPLLAVVPPRRPWWARLFRKETRP